MRNPATAPYNSTKIGSASTPYRRRLEGKFMRRLTRALQAVHFWRNRKSQRVYRTPTKENQSKENRFHFALDQRNAAIHRQKRFMRNFE
jgi:hypothetical protein